MIYLQPSLCCADARVHPHRHSGRLAQPKINQWDDARTRDHDKLGFSLHEGHEDRHRITFGLYTPRVKGGTFRDRENRGILGFLGNDVMTRRRIRKIATPTSEVRDYRRTS